MSADEEEGMEETAREEEGTEERADEEEAVGTEEMVFWQEAKAKQVRSIKYFLFMFFPLYGVIS
jgi:hypothetical protein